MSAPERGTWSLSTYKTAFGHGGHETDKLRVDKENLLSPMEIETVAQVHLLMIRQTACGPIQQN